MIQLHELVRFFMNPIAYLINRRLQVYLREADVDVPDREPWQLDKLEEWDVATTLLELELEGRGKSSLCDRPRGRRFATGTAGPPRSRTVDRQGGADRQRGAESIAAGPRAELEPRSEACRAGCG